jgi:tryptophanyl-tRNA synthetase
MLLIRCQISDVVSSCLHKEYDTHSITCRYALSGGRKTVEEHRQLGADLSVDVPYKWLEFFQEDDARFKEIGEEYAAGRMLTGEVKAELIEILQKLVARHQRARSKVTLEVVRAFMEPRVMDQLWG